MPLGFGESDLYSEKIDYVNEDGKHTISSHARKERRIISNYKNDEKYWEMRRRNNDSARRSRAKRRIYLEVLKDRIIELTRENCKLKNEIAFVKKQFRNSIDTFQGGKLEQRKTESPNDFSVINCCPDRQAAQLFPSLLLFAPQKRWESPKEHSPAWRRHNTFEVPQTLEAPRGYPELHESTYACKVQNDSDLKVITEDNEVQPCTTSIKDQTIRHNFYEHFNPLSSSVSLLYFKTETTSQQEAHLDTSFFPTSNMTLLNENELHSKTPVQQHRLQLMEQRPYAENEPGRNSSIDSSRRCSILPFSSNMSGLPPKLRRKQRPINQAPALQSRIYAPNKQELTRIFKDVTFT